MKFEECACAPLDLLRIIRNWDAALETWSATMFGEKIYEYRMASGAKLLLIGGDKWTQFQLKEILFIFYSERALATAT